MLGWERLAAARASCRKRCWKDLSCEILLVQELDGYIAFQHEVTRPEDI